MRDGSVVAHGRAEGGHGFPRTVSPSSHRRRDVQLDEVNGLLAEVIGRAASVTQAVHDEGRSRRANSGATENTLRDSGVQLHRFSISAASASGILCFSCTLVSVLCVGFVIGPPIFVLLYVWAWIVWIGHSMDICDQPLDSWLGVYLMFTMLLTCGRKFILQTVCRWRPSEDERTVPLRVRLVQLSSAIFLLAWMVYGRVMLGRSKTCSQTSARLYGFVDLFTCAAVLLHSLCCLWNVCTFASGPVLIWFARRGSLRPLLRWIAEQGFLETSSAASANTINEMECVEFDSGLFADPSDPADSRPPGECCICLQPYDAVKQISRTPCGHMLHRECLGMWLRTARTCPACRTDLNAATRQGEAPC